MSFARTKIQPPRPRPGTVDRPALGRRLDEALGTHRLVLLVAPAGFGKTALLTQAVARLAPGHALAWVSCDEDDDLQRLLACLCSALEPIDPPWRSDPDALAARASGSRSQRREVADELLNVLAACDVEGGLIVLDDAHRIEDPAVFEFLDLLLPALPPPWVLVLSGRELPPLALPRLRVMGELAEFREADLQFGPDEVAAWLQATPGAAQRVAVEQLLDRTHGWAVGLRLALDSLADGRPQASALRSAALDRHVFDYLAAEVLDRMPADLRRFLLRCSVLPELTPDRCAMVSGDPRAERWLEEIERRGLFVSTLDGPELTLRLHELFRDFLEDRLKRELPNELATLLQLAAAGEEDPMRRVGYLLRAGEHAKARDALVGEGVELLTRGVVAPVLRLIEQFPAAERDGPELQLVRALGNWALWRFDAMVEAAHLAAAASARRGDDAGRRRAQAYEAIALNGAARHGQVDALLGKLLAEPLADDARACALHADAWQALDGGPLAEVAGRFHRELDLVERLDTAPAWYQASPVARYLGLPGMVAALQRYIDGALRHAGAEPSPLRVIAVTIQAMLEVWAGRPDEAEALLLRVEDDARWLGPSRSLRTQTTLCRALLHALRGEATEALAAAHRPVELLEDEPEGPRRRYVLNVMLTHEARLAAVLGDTARLRRRAAELAAVPADEIGEPARAQRALLAAYLADADGRSAEALRVRREALRNEDPLCRLGMGVETRLRLGAALLATEGIGAAAAAVAPALAATDDATELAPVLLAGPAVLDALASAPWDVHLDPGDAQRLARWAARARQLRRAPSAGAAPTAAAAAGPADLSARETEVLAHIAAGDSNKLIARALALSPHTVKRHVANILDKLGLDSRGQAAAWYRQHPLR